MHLPSFLLQFISLVVNWEKAVSKWLQSLKRRQVCVVLSCEDHWQLFLFMQCWRHPFGVLVDTWKDKNLFSIKPRKSIQCFGWREFFATVKSATLSLSDCPTYSLSDLCKMHHLSDLYTKCVICPTCHLSDLYKKCVICPTYTQNASFVRPTI